MLWFTEYNVGKIGSFDPKTKAMREYDTNSPSSGPYAIWVDIYDNVWFSMTRSYKVGKIEARGGFDKMVLNEYDLPTPRTIIRFIYADHEGKIWFPNNNNNKIGVIIPSTQQRPDVEQRVPVEMPQIRMEKPVAEPPKSPMVEEIDTKGQLIGLPIMCLASIIGIAAAIAFIKLYRKKPA